MRYGYESAAETSSKPSVADNIGQTLAEFEGLIEEFERFADRYFGSAPAIANGLKEVGPNGLLPEWDNRLRALLNRFKIVADRMAD